MTCSSCCGGVGSGRGCGRGPGRGPGPGPGRWCGGSVLPVKMCNGMFHDLFHLALNSSNYLASTP